MREPHDRAADRAEAELADMERRSERLEDDIESTRKDWERKKEDPSVPGAGGDPRAARSGLPPEANEPGGGSAP